MFNDLKANDPVKFFIWFVRCNVTQYKPAIVFIVRLKFNINTQTGTPIEWADYFKYYFTIPGSKIKPYADAGFGLYFVTGGPYFDIRFGGGACFPIANKLYIPADLQLGPIFVTGLTRFIIIIRSGIRYEI